MEGRQQMSDELVSIRDRLDRMERKAETIFECIDVLVRPSDEARFEVIAKTLSDLNARITHDRTIDICLVCHLPKIWSCHQGTTGGFCICPPEPAPQFTVDVMLGEMGSNGSWVRVYYYHDDKNWICHMQGYVGKNEDFFGSSHSLKEAVRLCYTNWKEGTK
jgi:hypothetical protein